MALTDSRAVEPVAVPAGMPDTPRTGRWRGFATAAGVAAVVAVLAQFPLVRNRIFYYWDDSAAAFLPDWYAIGEQLRAGSWPLLRPEMWMGGNFAAESMLGLFNPMTMANSVLVSLLPDLAVAATLVKTEYLVLLALGVYLLSRDFGAGRRSAAVVATALPFSGYTLYFDAAAWPGGLMAFAHLPYLWWSLRKLARGELNPIVPIVIGYLTMTVGNPYGALGSAVIVVAVAAEQLAQRRAWRAVVVLLTGVLIAITTVVVYLPLVGSSAVTWRTSTGVVNDGSLVPNLGDLFALSAPTYQPQYPAFASGLLTFPSFYLAWFILPLIPWLRWSALRERFRQRSSLVVFGAVFLLFLLGPSNLWLFRWPSRLTEYVYLPVCVAVAVLLTRGLKSTYRARRALGSLLLVLAGAYLSWASTPQHLTQHVLATVLVLALLAAVLFTYRRRPGLYGGVLVVGTAVLLGLQVLLYTGNYNITPWRFPHNVADLNARFDGRYQGNTLEIIDYGKAGAEVPMTPDGLWRDVLPTNLIHTAGVDALNSYSGIGNTKFSAALCMNYYGGTCADAFRLIWQPVAGTAGAPLADVLGLRTVVVDPDFTVGKADPADADDPGTPIEVPSGWSVVERTDYVVVYRRAEPPAWPAGRLSWTAPGVRVTADDEVGPTGERVSYQGGGRAIFAMLAWPGYQATVDGRAVEIRQGPAGLLEVDLPASAAGGSTLELSFTPPGHRIGIPLLIAGLSIGACYGVAWQILRRRRPATELAEERENEVVTT